MKRNNSIALHPSASLNPHGEVEWFRKKPKEENYTRRRVGALVGGLALLTAGGVVSAKLAEKISDTSPICSGSETHLVQEGDTVWGIASSVEGVNEVPKQKVVKQIIELNDVSGVLHPGESLQIPTKCD